MESWSDSCSATCNAAVPDPLQLMLYEIGVRENHRRRGIGRTLIDEMERWMKSAEVASVWVLADNTRAEAFYTACGFSRDEPQPVQMSRRLSR